MTEQINISYGSAHNIVHDTLNFRKVSARWVPKNLTEEQMGQRMMTSLDNLMRYSEEGDAFREGVVTGEAVFIVE